MGGVERGVMRDVYVGVVLCWGSCVLDGEELVAVVNFPYSLGG